MRNYFRFLKPNKWVIILSILVVLIATVIISSVTPMIGNCDTCKDKCASIILYETYCVNNSGANLVLLANLILGVASLIILYTVLSLIIYLGEGEWKNDR